MSHCEMQPNQIVFMFPHSPQDFKYNQYGLESLKMLVVQHSTMQSMGTKLLKTRSQSNNHSATSE